MSDKKYTVIRSVYGTLEILDPTGGVVKLNTTCTEEDKAACLENIVALLNKQMEETMDVEKALNAIEEWYNADSSFCVEGISMEHAGSKELFDQSPHFLNVYGVQNIDGFGGFSGLIWFEFKPGKFVKTSFRCSNERV